MLRFVIDEDMPRSTAAVLKTRNYNVLDIRDYGLRGKSDEEIFKFAQQEKALQEREKRYAYICNDFTLAIYDYKRNQMTFQVSKAF
ncbi:MAG: DUF5615 family PIN-like protein [Actinobacteria bacterium]|nr:DUF5615 family PIN-like protein [Actinomycetota bacterium]